MNRSPYDMCEIYPELGGIAIIDYRLTMQVFPTIKGNDEALAEIVSEMKRLILELKIDFKFTPTLDTFYPLVAVDSSKG